MSDSGAQQPNGRIAGDDGDKSRKYRLARNGGIALFATGTAAFAAAAALHATIDLPMFVTFPQWAYFSIASVGVSLGIYAPANVLDRLVLTRNGAGVKKAT